MKYYLLFLVLGASSLLFVNCSKDKAPTGFTTADCPDTIKFSTQILPMMTDNCFSCHNTGQSPALSDHASIAGNADKILKTLKAEGAPLMPDGGPALPDSLIQQFQCWLNQGKLNN